jgi:hypothetical protein
LAIPPSSDEGVPDEEDDEILDAYTEAAASMTREQIAEILARNAPETKKVEVTRSRRNSLRVDISKQLSGVKGDVRAILDHQSTNTKVAAQFVNKRVLPSKLGDKANTLVISFDNEPHRKTTPLTLEDLCVDKVSCGEKENTIEFRQFRMDEEIHPDQLKKMLGDINRNLKPEHLYPKDGQPTHRFITRAPDIMRSDVTAEPPREVERIYKFRLPLADYCTQKELHAMMEQCEGNLYLTMSAPPSDDCSESYILTAEVIDARNDTGTDLRAVIEVPSYSNAPVLDRSKDTELHTEKEVSLNSKQQTFRVLKSDDHQGAFNITPGSQGAVIDAYGINDARVFDSRIQCTKLVGDPNYHRWCNVGNIDGMLEDMRHSMLQEADSDEHWLYYLVPLPDDNIPTTLAQYMVLQHNIELCKASELIPPRAVSLNDPLTKEQRRAERVREEALQAATTKEFQDRDFTYKRKLLKWAADMELYKAKMQNKSDTETIHRPIQPSRDGLDSDAIREWLVSSGKFPVLEHLTQAHVDMPKLVKNEDDGRKHVRVPVAAMEAVVLSMANLYNPEQMTDKSLMRVRCVTEKPNDAGQGFLLGHMRQVMRQHITGAFISVTVRTTEVHYTNKKKQRSDHQTLFQQARMEASQIEAMAQELSDQACFEVKVCEAASAYKVQTESVVKEFISDFCKHARDEQKRNEPIFEELHAFISESRTYMKRVEVVRQRMEQMKVAKMTEKRMRQEKQKQQLDWMHKMVNDAGISGTQATLAVADPTVRHSVSHGPVAPSSQIANQSNSSDEESSDDDEEDESSEESSSGESSDEEEEASGSAMDESSRTTRHPTADESRRARQPANV